MAKILVVDDNDGVRMTLKFILEGVGHKTLLAQNGVEGLAVLGAEPVDMLITDMVMPEMDGSELMMRVREKYNSLPILAISGGGNKINMDEAIEIARTLADRVLKKPVTRAEVLEVVNSLLAEKK